VGSPDDVTVVASASGTRIDCDSCREHTSSPDLTREQLRRATGYTRLDGRDLCPDCAASETTRAATAARHAPVDRPEAARPRAP